ncbi:hypothetical protein N5W20_08225 [Candidatus Kirkpatrickella diaphorinae]|uniref:Uncharacterized protein n=1 Tax=Candidatus Kirkpatrickella diaphorinae TaxID=2984322 RepID=A0ABY6GHS6_9PROT|nr:hypothetical protein [Candidatus Kirkpatrickella diaphorinae]UYH51065.1 hypothetical protein N5W20_08225 [Candidatus Kirkpatrickella diaphorinae]
MTDYSEINGADADGAIPESIIAECRNALTTMNNHLTRDEIGLHNVRRVVFAVRDGEALLACQTVLAGWFDGISPIMTLRVQPRFRLKGQRLSLSVTLEEADASMPVYDDEEL